MTEADAAAWLERVCSDPDLWGKLAEEAATQLNRLLHGPSDGRGDPYIADVDPARAVAVRFGFGTGEDVADGRWRRAGELSELERGRLTAATTRRSDRRNGSRPCSAAARASASMRT